MEARTITALTLYQPWASLWASGRKIHETRSWATRHRGLLAIHAAAAVPAYVAQALDGNARLRQAMEAEGYLDPKAMPRGRVLGIGWLSEVLPAETVIFEWRHVATEPHLGDFSSGRFAWRLAPCRLCLEPPLEARGRQGLWRWQPPDDLDLEGLAP